MAATTVSASHHRHPINISESPPSRKMQMMAQNSPPPMSLFPLPSPARRMRNRCVSCSGESHS